MDEDFWKKTTTSEINQYCLSSELSDYANGNVLGNF